MENFENDYSNAQTTFSMLPKTTPAVKDPSESFTHC